MIGRPLITPLRSRAALLLVLVVAVFVTFPVFGRGADAGRVVLINQTFECSSYPQPVNFELVKVTITAQAGPKLDGIHTGPRCTGRIGRVEVDTSYADGVKVHPGTHDLVIEGGYVRCRDRVGAVHQDGIQAMGGQRVTFKNLTVDCPTANNGVLFIAQGAGGRELPTDIVCDGCTLVKGATRNRVLRIATSLRSGARNSMIVWCGTGPECGPGGPVSLMDGAIDPVNENNRLVLYGDYTTAPQPGPPSPRRTLVLRQFTLSNGSPKAGTRLFAHLTVSGISGSDGNVVATCRATVAGKALAVVGRGSNGGKSRCAFAVPRTAAGEFLTGLVGLTSGGSTVNRSFTVRVAQPGGPPAPGGRVAAVLRPVVSGASLRRFTVSNQRPVAGKTLFGTVTLAGLEAGGVSLTCSGVAGGKPLRVLGSGFKAPTARCGWRVPAGVEGKALRISMSLVRAQGAIFTHSFHLTVGA